MRAQDPRAEPEPRVDARSTRLSAILLTTLTGFTGLAYEVTWQMISKRFSSHYHQAFPFERRALRAAWEACRGESCASARRAVENDIGSLDLVAGETM